MVVREPIGVVGLVLPWNFPLLMLAWKIGPSLAAGCSIEVKPAQETTLSALRVAELAHQAGGVFNVVPGGGKEAGEPLGRHPDVAVVSFTGSTATGRLFLKYAAESNLKRIVLELGGKNPAVVMNDVEDLDQVAQHVVNGAFWNMGENCSATSRLIVHREVKDALLERVQVHLQDWQLGDPLDPENRLGSMVSKAHFDKVRAYLEHARAQQLKLVTGGTTRDGVYVEPTIVDGVTPDSRLFREEIFGPVLSVTSFDTLDEALALANDTAYGLAASAYTGNLRNAIKLARGIRAGIVTVNCFGEGDASTPFGGYQESGFGGRDKSLWAPMTSTPRSRPSGSTRPDRGLSIRRLRAAALPLPHSSDPADVRRLGPHDQDRRQSSRIGVAPPSAPFAGTRTDDRHPTQRPWPAKLRRFFATCPCG